MKSLFFLVLCVLPFAQLAFGSGPALKMEERLSLQFIVKTLETLQKVAPEQEEAFLEYDRELKAMLMDARALQREHHLAEQKGLRGQAEVEKTRREGEKLLEQALLRTETYLQELLNGLKQHRQTIKTTLLPKAKHKK